MSCPNCGSWAVRADRSLAGRMVCGRCGEPLGAKVIPLRRARRRRWLPAGRPLQKRWLALVALLGVSGVLAALQMQEEQPWQPPRERRAPALPQRVF